MFDEEIKEMQGASLLVTTVQSGRNPEDGKRVGGKGRKGIRGRFRGGPFRIHNS